jgi:ABC-2 type transport system ATP-binding protein
LNNAVEIHDLRVIRGDNVVIPSLDAEVEPGKITGLLGPSGCGKSTLLRAIVGVQIVAGGEIAVLGRPAGAAELRREVGYVTQAPSVYADLTARENLDFFAAVIGADADRVGAALDSVGLADRADQLVGTMSGGQRARISLATALLGSPRLLILDEPTVGLDPVLRESLWAMFSRLADSGATLIVSSHVMDEAERCDSLLLMRDGGLLATGTPAELREEVGARDVGEAFLRLIERSEMETTAA